MRADFLFPPFRGETLLFRGGRSVSCERKTSLPPRIARVIAFVDRIMAAAVIADLLVLEKEGRRPLSRGDGYDGESRYAACKLIQDL